MDTNNDTSNEPKGIGGWLILVAIGLVITPIRLLYSVFTEIIPVTQSEILEKVNSVGFNALIYGELIVNLLFTLFAIILLVMLLQERKLFPKMAIIFYAANLFFVILDMVIVSNIPIISEYGMDGSIGMELLRAIIGSAIWIPYFMFSKRVKNTFVD